MSLSEELLSGHRSVLDVDYLTQLYQKFPKLSLLEADPWQAASDHFAQSLQADSQLASMLEELLGIDRMTLGQLGLGFSDRSLGRCMPDNQVKHGRAIRSRLEELGLYKASGHEVLRGCFTVPLRDDSWKITGVLALRFRRSKFVEHFQLGQGRVPSSLQDRLQALGVTRSDSSVESPSVQEPSVQELSVELPTSADSPELPTQQESPQEPSVSVDSQASHDHTTTTISSTLPDSLPTPPPKPFELRIDAHQVTFVRGDRYYRVQGLDHNRSSLTLKVQLQASRFDNVHLDTLDLARARSRASFIRAAANELLIEEEIVKKDVGMLLLQLEELRNQQIEAAKKATIVHHELSPIEREEALSWLQQPNLMQRVIDDLSDCGMVGESNNMLVVYLATISRLLSHPLAVLIQSSSSAGKTTLMDTILGFVPPEQLLRWSNLTSQSLYYLEPHALCHKTLAISEDEGLAHAAYALKLLQSEGKLSHASVAKSPHGKMVTQSFEVEGPVQLLLTSTGIDLDEELVNRCLVVTVDESREQTLAIQQRQRVLQTRQGQHRYGTKLHAMQSLHRNAQRLLRPMRVYNPWAEQLGFASDRTRLRRDHAKYLSLIQAIALLHQYQRPIRWEQEATIESIEVQPEDIAWANRLMTTLLGRSLDELPPQSRRCLHLLEDYVHHRCQEQVIDRSHFRFTRREFREHIGWSDFQVRIHFAKLVELEYLLPHRGKQGKCYVYELLYDGQGQNGKPFCMGLKEVLI